MTTSDALYSALTNKPKYPTLAPEEVSRLGGLKPATQYATPPATQVALAGQTARRVRLAQRFLPTKDPTQASLYYHLATDPAYADDRAYMDAVATAGGFGKAREYVRFFKKMGPSTSEVGWQGATHVWDDLSDRQQAYLQAMGVMDPRERRAKMQAGGSGLVGSLMGDIWDVAGTPLKEAGKVAGEGLSHGLEAVGKPLSAVNTAYRVLSLTVGKTPEGDNFLESFGTLTPAAIWNRAKYAVDVAGEGGGERAVHMVDRDRALDILGGNQHLLDHALDAMVSGDPTAIALQMATSRAKARGYSRQSDPDAFQKTFQDALDVVRSKRFTRAVSTLQAGKVSPGRDFVRSVLKPGDGEFNVPGLGHMNLHQVASGLVDATWTVYLDPVIVGGAFLKGVRVGTAAKSWREIPSLLRAGAGQEWEAGLQAIRENGYHDIIKMAGDQNFRKEAIEFARSQGLTQQEMWANDYIYALEPGPDRAKRLGALFKLHGGREPAFVESAVTGHLRQLGWVDNTPVGTDEVLEASEDIGRMLASGSPEEQGLARKMIADIQIGKQTALATNEGIATPEGFRKFMTEGEGVKAVLGGETTTGVSPSIGPPQLTRRSEFMLRSKLRFEDRLVEWQKLGGWKEYAKGLPVELPEGVTVPPAPQGLDKIKAGVAQFVTGVTQQNPTEAVVGAFGPDGGKNLSQWLRFSMPYEDAYKWIGDFYNQTNAAGRRIIAHQAVAEGLTRFGLRDTEFFEMWTSGLDKIGAARSLVYDVNPRNSTILLNDGSRVPAALFKSQFADNYLALPSLREMTKALPKLAAYRDLMTGRSTMRALDTGLIDSGLNRFWKPLVLLRLGFIPRAAGEETLAWFAREPGELAKAWVAYPFHYPERWEGEVASPMRWIARAERRFRHFDFQTEYDRIYEAKRELADLDYPDKAVAEMLKRDVLDYETTVGVKGGGRKTVPFYAKGSAYNANKGGTAFRKKPLYFFDPADVRGTLKLQGLIKDLTGHLLDDADHMALNAITDQEAIVRSYMHMVVGGDHYMFPSYAETKGSRGELLLGAPPLANQRHLAMVRDPSRHYTHDADDPLIDIAHDTVYSQSALDAGIRVPVAHAITGYIPPSVHAQIDTVLTGGSRRAVAETSGAMSRADRPLKDDFKELLSITSATKNEARDEAEAALRERISKGIAKIEDSTDRGALANLLQKWDTPGFNNEFKSAVIQDRRALYAGLDPTLPDDAKRIRLLDEAFDSTDSDIAEAAHNQLLRDTVRADLLGPDARLDQMERAQMVGGRQVAAPALPNQHRIWFPMMGRADADTIAQRLAHGDIESRNLLVAYNYRLQGEVPGGAPGDFVPFGYWGHDDPRVAAEWGQRLSRDEVPYTIGYVDVPKEWTKGMRSAGDPVGEYRGMQPPHFDRSGIHVAPTVDEVVRIGEQEAALAAQARGLQGAFETAAEGAPVSVDVLPQHGVGATYDEMIESIVDARVEAIKHRFMQTPEEGGAPRYGIARPVGEGEWHPKYLRMDGVSKPSQQIGPSLTFANRNIWDDFVRWGFDRVIAPAIDTIVRRPMFISSMAKAYRQAEVVTGGMLHAPMLTKVTRAYATEEGATRTVEHTIDIEALAKRFGFTKRVGSKTVADIDQFHRTLAPTLRWARDSGLPVDSVQDLQEILMRRAADLNTEGITDITRPMRRMLNDARAEGGAETLVDHPIGRILGDVAEDRRVILDRRPPDTTRVFSDNGTVWRTRHPENPDLEGIRYVDIPNSRMSELTVDKGSGVVDMPDELLTDTVTPKRVGPVTHEYLGPQGKTLAKAKARGRAADAIELRDEEVKALNKWFLSEDDARGQLAKIAGSRAFNENIRYIDDHTIRSQYADNIRNLVPFYFAEEQFLKRWARTIAYDPAGIRKVQLLKHGLDSIGFIKKDPQTGADYFEYPFSAELNEVLGKVSNTVFGGEHTLPIFVPLTGQVRYALPGLDNKGLPQVGPVISIPLKALANRFPEMRDAEYTILGSRAAGLPMVSQVVPASVGRFWQAFTASPDRSREMASTMTAVVQLMEAEGLTPDEHATPKDRERYLDRVENWSRTMMLTRAILGFAGPAAPSADVPGKELSAEFRDLLKELPIGDAAATFISANPDATPFTVFRSKSVSGAALPTGKRTLDWMEKNRDLIETYPQGAPWLIPQDYAEDDFESQSYNQQLALGMRERRMPEEMYDEIKFAKASPRYFDTRDEYQKRITLARAQGSSAQATALEEEYGRWRTSYLAQNPIFAEQLASPTARQRRLEVLDQLTEMVEDPRLTTSQRVSPSVRYILDAWNQYDAAYSVLRYDRSKTATLQRQQLKVNMFNHLESYTRDHRDARALYLRVIRPELEVDAGVAA